MEKIIDHNEDSEFLLQVWFPQYNILTLRDYIDKFDNFILENSDPDGFISDALVHSFSKDVEVLLKQVESMGKEKPRLVFEVCKYIISRMPELPIDDSYGTTYEIVDVVCETIEFSNVKDDLSISQEISKWIKEMLEDEGILNCCLENPLKALYTALFS